MSRAYYRDAYTTRFAAAIDEALVWDGRPAVRLVETYFYPTSGGQPHDTGTLGQGEASACVVEVVVREADDAVLHVLDSPLGVGPAEAVLDWSRRFDHMQHHTGQHILSQAFIRVAAAETVSFHLSQQSVTIDLDSADLPAETVSEAEDLANAIIWQNRPVSVRWVAPEEAAALPLRKIPPGRDGQLRLIDIANFDLTACGGTHVAGTAEVGLIKVVKTERRGETTRVTFCCGERALADYRLKHDIVQQVSGALTMGLADLPASVAKLKEEGKQLRADLKRQQLALLAAEAAQLVAAAEPLAGARLVVRVFPDRPVEEVRELAKGLAAAGGVVALLGSAGERAQLVFGRSADGPVFAHVGNLIAPALAVLGARGGGGALAAQGGGVAADEATVATALAVAVSRLREAANAVE